MTEGERRAERPVREDRAREAERVFQPGRVRLGPPGDGEPGEDDA